MGLFSIGKALFLNFVAIEYKIGVNYPIFLHKVDASYEKRACKLNIDLLSGYILR
jgi:hypothetical protein